MIRDFLASVKWTSGTVIIKIRCPDRLTILLGLHFGCRWALCDNLTVRPQSEMSWCLGMPILYDLVAMQHLLFRKSREC